ncbi:TonB-dependent receptor [Dysgonomonas sp. Marseille-P4677]|nr:TonB-dependent receptor [Dysgonomonas sp. Marseille-P4677]
MVLVLLPCEVFAQTKTITGVVTDEMNETLIGVSVKVVNTNQATITDIDGRYSISAQKGDELHFSYIGRKSLTIKVGDSEIINVILEGDVTTLGAVEIEVGYGKIRKRDLTGSIVSVSTKDLIGVPTNNPISALQGKVPGLNIVNSGTPGAAPEIRLRGVGTLNADTKPIFVVDGMIVDNIDFVNMNDILSLEVLKDPSSLSIFGVQGANGVIIITTNRGQAGKTQVKYDGYVGVQYLANRDRLKLTDATEFTVLYNERLMNEYYDELAIYEKAIASGKDAAPPAIPSPWEGDLLGKGTDWQKEIFHPAIITNHHLSVSTGNDKSTSMISAGYYKQDGIVRYNSYERLNLNYAGDIKVNKAIKLGTNVGLSRWETEPMYGGVLPNAARALPTYSPYRAEADRDYSKLGGIFTPPPGIQSNVGNPVATMETRKGTQEPYGYRAVGNIYAEISFLKDFKFKATGFFDVGINNTRTYTPIYDVNYPGLEETSQRNLVATAKKETNEYTKLQADFILNYDKTIDKHKIGAMAGYTAYENKHKGFSAHTDSIFNNEENLPEDLWTLDEKAKKLGVGNSFGQSAFISYLSRVNYSYDNKYLLTATFRADGSSKFAANHRWGYFPSIGAGWVISEENFMESFKEKIDFLKLRASWGKLGNDKIGDFQNYRRIDPQGSSIILDGNTIYLPTIDGLADENLHWEVMTGVDVGIEGYFFQQRLTADVGYYYKKNSDLLATVPLPAAIGPNYKVTNAGSVSNSGIEFNVSWRDKVGDFAYNTSFNGSTIRNRVVSLGNNNASLSHVYHRTSVGHPIGSFYGYVQDGIFQTDEEIAAYYPSAWVSRPGDIRFKDVNGDEKIDSNDRTFIGSSIPTFVYGFSIGFEYKNFDINMNFNGVSGNKILNKKKLPTFAQFNYYEDMIDRWHGVETSNSEPMINAARGHNHSPSTNLLEDGSYIRLRGVQLGYNVPTSVLSKLGVSSLRVYCNAENLLTFKKNSGYTPEVSGSILEGAVDDGGTYPLPMTITGGVMISF